jgi:YD repeat-containing protein
VLSYLYDANGNRTRVTHPDTNFFDYVYDSLNRMTEVREGATTVRATIAYDNFGRRSGLGRVAGENTTYGYDAASRLNNLAQVFPGGAGTMTTGFTYSPASQMKTRDFSNDAYAYRGDVNVNRPYAKNGLNQYTNAGPASFTYDANGNLTGDGGTSYAYDVENRLKSATGFRNAQLTYDPI